jgi:RHS repeat-associated protein
MVTYAYDSQSRRIARTEYPLPLGEGQGEGAQHTLYLYDGWNCLAEYALQNSSFNLHTSLSWGLDLSDSLQGAGGVGGLLAITKHQAQSTTHYFPTFDGNGNVSEYLTASGAIAAHYEYDPFGRTIVASGDHAGDFAYRFSTKPIDAATGLSYYGYRWYDPYTGRWPSRDPIEERGGGNLYGFVGNSGLDAFDFLGMKWKEVAGTLKTSGPWQHQTTRLNVIDYSAPPSVIIQLASNQLKLRYSANGTACCENTTTGARKKIEDNRYKEVNASMGTMLGTFIQIDLGKSPKDFLYDSVLDVADATTKGKMVAAATKLASVIRDNTPALGDPGDGWDTTVPSPQGHGCARLDILHP